MRAIDAAISAPDVGGILVCGAAGVGKSRIAREALSVAASQGRETRWTVGASSARSIPLGAFAAWAPSGVTDSVALLRGVVESLTAAPSGVEVVIGVDDAHLLDELSTFVVHQIVARGAAKVILTVRDGAPFPAALQEIWNVGRFDRLDLAPLPANETSTLLSAALGGSVEPDAAARLWKLTHGNALYLQNIVEQEIADGRIALERECWRWTGDPKLRPGLAELIESRIGDLPSPVADVIDLLAVGEPIELATLSRITEAGAVEDAEVRGLITLEPAGGGIEVRVAHPLYGEVRRERAARTRLRRLRGLVAGELAASDDRDDVRVVVRRAALSIDSDLAPDADLLVRAANGAVWLADLALADRLAEAAVKAGGGPEPSFIRAHALSWLGRGEEAEAVLAGIRAGEMTDQERARFAFLRSSNMLWALGDPARAKTIIDEAARDAPADARTYIDAFLTVYWFAMDQPQAAVQASKSLALTDIPVVGAEIAWVLAQISADAGGTDEAIDIAEAGYDVATRTLDAPAHEIQHRRRAHQCSASGRPCFGRARGGRPDSRTSRRTPRRSRVAWRCCCRSRRSRRGRSANGVRVAGSGRRRGCRRRMRAGGDTATESPMRLHLPSEARATRPRPRCVGSTAWRASFDSWISNEDSPRRGLPRAKGRSARRSRSCRPWPRRPGLPGGSPKR